MESALQSGVDEQQQEPLDGVEEVTQSVRASPVEEYSHVSAVRRQHRVNLGAIMRHAMLTADYYTAVGAVGALLACQPQDVHLFNTTSDLGAEVQHFIEMQWNAIELLRQHKVALEQIKRIIRKTAALLLHELGMRQTCQIELALAFWNRSYPDEFKQGLALTQHELSRAGRITPTFVYHMSVLAAYMQHSQWLYQLQGTATKPQQHSQASAACSQQRQLLGFLQLPFQPYKPNAARLASQFASQAESSRSSTADGVEDIIKHLKRALEVFPAASLPTLLQCHTLVAADKAADALLVARTAVSASGRSVESLSLLALLLQPPTAAAAVGIGSAPAVIAAAVRSQFGREDASQGLLLGSSSQHEAGQPDDEQQDKQDVERLHEFVALCLEVVRADPWSTGALQGLIQHSSHCNSCATHAVVGLLSHLDAAAVEAAVDAEWGATDAAAAAANATLSMAPQWSVLSVLLVQLAAAVAAAEVSAETCSAATPAGLASCVHTNAQRNNTNATADGSAVAAADQQPVGESSSVVQLWSTLQESFVERQAWWGTSPLAGVIELQLLWQQYQQQQDRHQQHSEQPASPASASQETSGQQQQHQQPSPDGANTLTPSGLAAAPVSVAAPTARSRSVIPEDESTPWSCMHQLLCCKAIALAFVLGVENAYTREAAAALAALAGEAAAGDIDVADPMVLSPGSSFRDDDTQPTAAAARAALIDAVALARLLSHFQLQAQRQQQEVAPTPKRLLGSANEEFGARLDLPDSWWASFPHKRRQQLQLEEAQLDRQEQCQTAQRRIPT